MMRLGVGTHTCACRSALLRATRSEVVCPVCKQFHNIEGSTAITGGVSSIIPFIAGTIKQLQRSLLLLLVR